MPLSLRRATSSLNFSVRRGLTLGERALVSEMFGTSIDCNRVTINARKWWWFQPKRVVMAPDGHMWCHPEGGVYCADYSLQSLELQALFIHEMTHVWQHQSGIFLPLRRHAFCRYGYTLKAGKPLKAYGIEQQAMIVQHKFMESRGAFTDLKEMTGYEMTWPKLIL